MPIECYCCTGVKQDNLANWPSLVTLLIMLTYDTIFLLCFSCLIPFLHFYFGPLSVKKSALDIRQGVCHELSLSKLQILKGCQKIF